jgi:hypothetical protein
MSTMECLSYCQNFKPTEYMSQFEIKRERYQLILNHLKSQTLFRERLSILRGDVNVKGRILVAEDFKDESESKIINEFNKEYETSLLIPIVYNPADDLVLLQNNLKTGQIYKPYRQYNF